MKNKRFLIIGGVIVVVLVIIVFLFFFFKGILEDNRVTNNQIVEIKKINVELNKYIEQYNDTRNTLSELLSIVYTDNLKEKYDDIVNLLKQEEEYVGNVKDSVLKLDKYCNNNIYSDSSANSICLSYKLSYEEMVNVIVLDIQNINGMVDTYLENHEGLDKYQSELNDYIDYNGDGFYSGKEE